MSHAVDCLCCHMTTFSSPCSRHGCTRPAWHDGKCQSGSYVIPDAAIDDAKLDQRSDILFAAEKRIAELERENAELRRKAGVLRLAIREASAVLSEVRNYNRETAAASDILLNATAREASDG